MDERYSFETNNVISCEEYAQRMKNNLKTITHSLDVKPTLLIIQVGDNPASDSYIKGKIRDCEEVGIEYKHIHFMDSISEIELLEYIEICNHDKSINGIIVQLPLPKHIDADKVANAISKEKDVDGFVIDSCFDPCTPKGVIDWLTYNNYDFVGKDVVVLGRSKIVGKPLVNMLIDRGATVTCCNSKTKYTEDYTSYADLIISAVGKPKHFTTKDFLIPKCVIVDVGINRDENGKLCGDIDRENILKYRPDTYVTPVPKGVGLLTRVALMQNTMEAYKLQNGM